MDERKRFVLSLGGSLIVPNGGIDAKFLGRFNELIRKKVAEGSHFFIVCGGGAVARHYRDAGQAVLGHQLTSDDLDWLGIHGTRINAHLVRTIFRDMAYRIVIKEYNRLPNKINKPVVVAAGWKPGWSTDYDAVILAEKYGAEMVVNMSNIKMVYDKDPNEFKTAAPIKRITWSKFRKLVGNRWSPGMNVPFDPVASEKAEKMGLRVAVLDGRDLKNLEKCLQGKEFVGTEIR